MSFHDHFSDRAAAYARFRPTYPPELFEWLAAQAPSRRMAWDAGTGSGQAAAGLARWFEEVVATDPSREQLGEAAARPRIRYRQAVEGDSGLPPGAADLATAAQALHWFDVAAFYREVRRTVRPGGMIAIWCYGLHRVEPAVDGIFDHFYRDVVGPYWPAERRHIETGYRAIPFPFMEVPTPEFRMTAELELDGLLGYVRTWSAVVGFEKVQHRDPVRGLREELEPAWGDPGVRRTVRWPLTLRAARIGEKEVSPV